MKSTLIHFLVVISFFQSNLIAQAQEVILSDFNYNTLKNSYSQNEHTSDYESNSQWRRLGYGGTAALGTILVGGVLSNVLSSGCSSAFKCREIESAVMAGTTLAFPFIVTAGFNMGLNETEESSYWGTAFTMLAVEAGTLFAAAHITQRETSLRMLSVYSLGFLSGYWVHSVNIEQIGITPLVSSDGNPGVALSLKF